MTTTTTMMMMMMMMIPTCCNLGPGSSVGILTDYGLDGPGSNPGGDEIFCPSRPALGPTQFPVNGYRVFPGGKVRPGRAADHSPPCSAAVMQEYSCASAHPLGHTGPVTGSLYRFTFCMLRSSSGTSTRILLIYYELP